MLVLVGTNYKYSPIELREKISFSNKGLRRGLCFLNRRKNLKGAVILSTCNRIEVYASSEKPDIGVEEIIDFISVFHEFDKLKLRSYLYIYMDRQAVSHLFRVASGLDSLVLGETQILGQVREAYYISEAEGFVDTFIKQVFSSAISTAGKVHSQTGISEGKVSIGSVGIDFIKDKVGGLDGKDILLVGVGKVTELVLKYLKKENYNVVFIANRTFEKARKLADSIGADAVRVDNLKEFLAKADIVITATKSPHFIIKKDTVEDALRFRPRFKRGDLLIMDLALPRDVDPRVKDLKGVEVFGLEDLDGLIQRNINRRRLEARKAEWIIDTEVERLWERFLESELEGARLL